MFNIFLECFVSIKIVILLKEALFETKYTLYQQRLSKILFIISHVYQIHSQTIEIFDKSSIISTSHTLLKHFFIFIPCNCLFLTLHVKDTSLVAIESIETLFLEKISVILFIYQTSQNIVLSLK